MRVSINSSTKLVASDRVFSCLAIYPAVSFVPVSMPREYEYYKCVGTNHEQFIGISVRLVAIDALFYALPSSKLICSSSSSCVNEYLQFQVNGETADHHPRNAQQEACRLEECGYTSRQESTSM